MALFSLSEPLFDVEFFPVAGLGNKYDMRGKKRARNWTCGLRGINKQINRMTELYPQNFLMKIYGYQ